MNKDDEVVAEIRPHTLRRGLGSGLLAALAGMLLWICVTRPPQDTLDLLFLLAFSVGSLFLAWQLWMASGVTLELTRTELREQGGRVLCHLDNVERVDRGFFAFKPAGGFLVKLKEPMPRVYAPGLWTRFGRRLAIGGVTSGPEAKAVADLMRIILAQRAGGM